MILITHIIILTILGLDLAAFIIIIGRRYYMGRFHRLLDIERERCLEIRRSLEVSTDFTEIALLRREPGSIGWRAVEGELFKALKSPDANRGYIRLFFDLLGYTDSYINTLNASKEWEQASALEKLSRLKCAKCLAPIIQALDSPKRDVRNMAAYALGEIRRKETAIQLIKHMKRVALNDEESSIRIIKSALISFGNSALPALTPELKNNKWRVRAAAVDILSEIGTDQVIQPLIDTLTDPERDVRAKAAKGLGKIRDVASVPALPLLSKTTDQFWVVRLHVVRALGMIKDPIAIECLSVRLGDNKWQVRNAAATALGTIGADAYLVLIEQYLRSNDRYTKEQAKEELAKSRVIDSLVDFIIKNRDRLSAEKPVSQPLINGGTIPPAVYVKMTDLLVSSGNEVSAEVIRSLTCEKMGLKERSRAIEILKSFSNGAGHEPRHSH